MDLFVLVDKPENDDGPLDKEEAATGKEMHQAPAAREDRHQNTSTVDGPDLTVEELAQQLAAKVEETSESSNDDADLDDDQLPEGFHHGKDGRIVYDEHPLGVPDADLAPHHWRELVTESAIDPELVRARGYMTVDHTDGAVRFLKGEGITPKALEPEHFPGLFVLMYRPNNDDADGAPETAQWKPAVPVINAKGKAQKYISRRGAGNILDVNPAMREAVLDPDRRLWIVEGVKKEDALGSHDEAAIGLTGVWNWRGKNGTLTDWQDVPLRDREVMIGYDADGREKADVRKASAALGAWLTEVKRAKVRYLFVPEEVNGRKVKGVDDYLAAGGTVDQLLQVATTDPPQVEADASDEFTDARLAERVAEEVLAGHYLWSPALDWLTWDGRRWSPCSDATAREAVRQWALRESTKVLEDAKRTGKYPDREVLAGWLSALSRGRLSAILDLARGIVEVAADELDADPDLLNTPDGVVDLRTGRVQHHDPAHLMTRITRGNYRPGYVHDDWTAALEALDPPERAWLQVRIGQAVTGHPTPDGILPVLQGSGENGKSLLTTDGAVSALGDYASMASAKLFSKGNEHSEEMASLRGKRFLVAEELAEGRSIDVTSLKRIQDVGLITARHVYQRNMTFPASHSLFTTTNYVPVVNEVDHGTWRRLALLRFPYTFRKPGEELETPNDRRGDPRLKARIRVGNDGQHDAMVSWVVDGARAWYADEAASLALTPKMEADKFAWRVEADRVLGFWSEYLVPDSDSCILTTEALATFNNWLKSNGHNTWPRETFGPRFLQHHETARHRVTKVRQLNPKGLDRTPDPLAKTHQLPARPEVYRGVCWRRQNDDKHWRQYHGPDSSDRCRDPFCPDRDQDHGPEGTDDPGRGTAGQGTCARGDTGPGNFSESPTRTEKVPDTLGTSGTSAATADDEDRDPEAERLQDQLDAILDWLADLDDQDQLAACPKCQAEELAIYPDDGLTVCLAEGCDYVRSRASFTDWLLDQTEHPDDLVRTLANDAADDRTWPDVENLAALERYVVHESGQDPQAREALHRAWSLYSGQPVDREDEVA
jgi:P4 family phage/plasmid primase-like protien